MRNFALVLVAGLAMASVVFVARAGAVDVEMTFVDSATGYSLQPEGVEARPHLDGSVARRIERSQVGADGRALMHLERGRHTVRADLSKYHSIGGEVEARENFPYKIRFLLDPLETPRELQAENIAARRRD